MEHVIAAINLSIYDSIFGELSILFRGEDDLISFEKLKNIKPLVRQNATHSITLKTNLARLWKARYLQVLIQEKAPAIKKLMNGIRIFSTFKKNIKASNFKKYENQLVGKIGKTIKNSSDLKYILGLVKALWWAKKKLSTDNFACIESKILIGLKNCNLRKNINYDFNSLKRLYGYIINIFSNENDKQEAIDIITKITYNSFRISYIDLLQLSSYNIIISRLDKKAKKIYKWMISNNCKKEICIKIKNFEPLIEESYGITCINQLLIVNPDKPLSDHPKDNTTISVCKAKIIKTGKNVIVKSFISPYIAKVQKYGGTELEIYQNLSAKNCGFILKFYGYYFEEVEEGYKLNIVLEYAHLLLAMKLYLWRVISIEI